MHKNNNLLQTNLEKMWFSKFDGNCGNFIACQRVIFICLNIKKYEAFGKRNEKSSWNKREKKIHGKSNWIMFSNEGYASY